MDQYKTYLATQVLNEGQIVTYRSLSRALKVHVNLAKQMLYAFHKTQTTKKPDSIHATYLISGTKRSDAIGTSVAKGKDGEDTVMDSSPFPSSWMETPTRVEPEIAVSTVTLVKEEDLDEARGEYSEIKTIHIYSLQPNSPLDVHLIATVSPNMFKEHMNEDPLVAWKQYGTIQNKNVARRTGSTETAPAITSKSTVLSAKIPASKSKPSAPSVGSKTGETSKSVPANGPQNASKAAPPKLKSTSSGKGDIFASFSKAKPKAKPSETNLEAAAAAAKDESMKDVFDEDNDEDEEEEEETTAMEIQKASEARKARKDREEQLRKMMDEDDEPMADAPPDDAEPDVDAEAMEAEEIDTTGALDAKENSAAVEPEEETVTISGGRRRGKRRVTKKVTKTDDAGYLVTTEEAAWESYSEDEPEAKRSKVMPTSAGNKKKGGAPTKAQGNIMSFFGKK